MTINNSVASMGDMAFLDLSTFFVKYSHLFDIRKIVCLLFNMYEVEIQIRNGARTDRAFFLRYCVERNNDSEEN